MQGLELVRILEASSQSLKQRGAPVELTGHTKFFKKASTGGPSKVNGAVEAEGADKGKKRVGYER